MRGDVVDTHRNDDHALWMWTFKVSTHGTRPVDERTGIGHIGVCTAGRFVKLVIQYQYMAPVMRAQCAVSSILRAAAVSAGPEGSGVGFTRAGAPGGMGWDASTKRRGQVGTHGELEDVRVAVLIAVVHEGLKGGDAVEAGGRVDGARLSCESAGRERRGGTHKVVTTWPRKAAPRVSSRAILGIVWPGEAIVSGGAGDGAGELEERQPKGAPARGRRAGAGEGACADQRAYQAGARRIYPSRHGRPRAAAETPRVGATGDRTLMRTRSTNPMQMTQIRRPALMGPPCLTTWPPPAPSQQSLSLVASPTKLISSVELNT